MKFRAPKTPPGTPPYPPLRRGSGGRSGGVFCPSLRNLPLMTFLKPVGSFQVQVGCSRKPVFHENGFLPISGLTVFSHGLAGIVRNRVRRINRNYVHYSFRLFRASHLGRNHRFVVESLISWSVSLRSFVVSFRNSTSRRFLDLFDLLRMSLNGCVSVSGASFVACSRIET